MDQSLLELLDKLIANHTNMLNEGATCDDMEKAAQNIYINSGLDTKELEKHLEKPGTILQQFYQDKLSYYPDVLKELTQSELEITTKLFEVKTLEAQGKSDCRPSNHNEKVQEAKLFIDIMKKHEF